MQRIPACIGDGLEVIETPALVVDLDPLERNLDRMADATKGIRLRPHAKSHKCATIARVQLDRGAVGICCQKTDEAAAFVDAGIGDVLVTNEVVAPSKIARLAELASRATVGVLVDAQPGVAALSEAAARARTVIDTYIEVDVGAHRCGVAPGPAAIALAKAIACAPGLRFRGLQAYQGAAQHLREPGARRDAIARATVDARRTREAIVGAGIACQWVTGAGTGTWQHERDSGLPLVHGRAGADYVKASDEHGVLKIAGDAPVVACGERIWLVPGHCDPTVNLYDWIVAVREGTVEGVWPVEARGALG